MPHIRNFDDFTASAALLAASADQYPTTRCSVAIRPTDSEVRIKVTNDRQCVQTLAPDYKALVAVTRAMIEKAQNRQPRAVVAAVPPASASSTGGEVSSAGNGKGGAGGKQQGGAKKGGKGGRRK